MPKTQATGQPAQVPLSVVPGHARRELKAMLTGGRWCRHVDLVVLAVHEALTNADRHGGGVSQVHACVDRGALVITVCDRGPGFEIPPAPVPDDTADDADPLAEDGRGLWLIRQIASRVEADRKDGDFCLRLRFDPP